MLPVANCSASSKEAATRTWTVVAAASRTAMIAGLAAPRRIEAIEIHQVPARTEHIRDRWDSGQRVRNRWSRDLARRPQVRGRPLRSITLSDWRRFVKNDV